MKRSKLFLGVTTCLLAVAGVAAAKSHFDGKTTKGFYCTKSTATPHCVAALINVCPTPIPAGTKVCKSTFAGGLYTIYTVAGTLGAVCSQTVCTHPLTYTNN